MSLLDQFLSRGWLTFPFDAAIAQWASAALPAAKASACDPAQAHWLRCGGTWFVGVDALPNDERGRVEDGPALEGTVMDFIRNGLGLDLPLHRAQVSVCYAGYPKPYEGELQTAYSYRLKRDAAHVDGLHAEGPERRRFLKEPHAYILGLPLNHSHPEAAPLVVWDGSHRIMSRLFAEIYAGLPPDRWHAIDVTEAYQAARREAFTTCERIPLPVVPGQATLLHRHVLHGVAPWGETAGANEDGRIIAYFRPEFRNALDWRDAA